jgi:hypothetical protein
MGGRFIVNTPGGIMGELTVQGDEMCGPMKAQARTIRVALRRLP